MFFSSIFSGHHREVCEHAHARTPAHLRERREEIGEKLRKRGMRLRSEVLDDGRHVLFEDDAPRAPHLRGVAGEIQGVLDRLGAVLDRIDRSAA